MKHLYPILLVSLFACTQAPTTQPDLALTITEGEILDHIKTLSDDGFEGRFPGTSGSDKAIDYITGEYKSAGIEPAGVSGYMQYFDFVTSVNLGKYNSLSTEDIAFSVEKDFIPLAFSSNAAVSSGLVFAGYGFSIDEDSLSWDDYSGVDVEGKWVLVLRGDPDPDNPHSEYAKYSALRKKLLVARDKGAAGVLFVSPYQDQFEPEELFKLRVNHRFSSAGIPALQVTRATADRLLTKTNNALADLQKNIDETMSPNSFDVQVVLSGEVSLETKSVEVPNIIGVLPGNDPALKDEFIIVGAHFDHLGYGGPGSGSRQPDTVAIHNGADDNASGVAGVLELAERLSANRDALKRSVLFMCYNAEEEGLLGSKFFTANPLVDLEKVALMINMDMIGRYNEKLVIGGVGTSPGFEMMLKEFNRSHNLETSFSNEGYGPSDHASFYIENVPVLFFFTGTHEDYHKPSDDWDKINTAGEVAIVNYVYDIALYLNQLEEKPVFTEAGPKERESSQRRFKVTFGVIPSYGSSAAGMEIDGTKKDGPAEKAGMMKGDVIIAINGGEIKDIYDYMYRLAELKAGEEVSVTITRGEETLELKLQL